MVVEVVVGALVRDGRVVLGHRRPDKHAFPATWDLPGGVVEDGEPHLDALARELREELGVEVDTSSVAHLVRVDLGTARLDAWLVADWRGEPANTAPEEHDDLAWFGLDELPPLAHPDVRAALGEALGTGVRGDASRPWQDLASGYEQARSRPDSLDRLVEWPAQRAMLGDVTGLSVLDAGCGNGAKVAQLVQDGAVDSVGVDISDSFITDRPPGLELLRGDLSDLAAVPGLAGRRFDRILFLQSFGYAADPVRALATARSMLTDDGFVLLTRTQPVRYALERSEENGTTLGAEYFSTATFPYRHRGWGEGVTLTKVPYTMSDLLNTFSAAGMWVEATAEPQLSPEAAAAHPHKQAVMEKYLGILVFRLRPLPR